MLNWLAYELYIKAYGWSINLLSNLWYKPHLSRQYNCWSLRCSWSITCRRCSNFIFILDLTPGFSGLGKDNCKTSFWIWCDLYWRFECIWINLNHCSIRDLAVLIWQLMLHANWSVMEICFSCFVTCRFCLKKFRIKTVHCSDHACIFYFIHDNIIKWRHSPHYWPFVWGIHLSPVNCPHKGQWRGALMVSLIWAWTNGWVNNGQAGDLKHFRAH